VPTQVLTLLRKNALRKQAPSKLLAREILAWLLTALGACPAPAIGQQPRSEKEQKQQTQEDLNHLTIEELMNVQVDTVYGASKFEQKVTQAPSSVTIVTADEIQKYGYRTVADLLQSVPGLYVTYDRNYTYVGLEGTSRPTDYNTHLLILIDGHRVNDNIYDGAYVGTEAILDIDLIQRVEIIRGPGSSLYGTNAFLGVINIITKKGRDLNGAEVSADGGSLQTYRGRTTYGQQFADGAEVLLSETVYDSKGHRQLFFPEFNSPATNNGIAQDDDTDQFHSTFLSTSYKGFSLRSGYLSREKHMPTGSYGTVFDDSRTETTDARAYADLQYTRPLGDAWELNARGYYDWYKYDGNFIYDYAGNGVPPFTDNKDFARGDWWGLDVAVSRSLTERHHLTLGTEETFNTKQVQGNYDQTPFFSYLSASHSSTQAAVYAQDEFAIRKNVLLSSGVRYDHYSTFGGTVNPRIGLILSPREATDIKILYGQAFRAPDDFELHYSSPAIGFESNPRLHSETIKTVELVFEKYFRQYTSLSASGFYKRTDNLISQATDPANGLIHFQNLDGIHTKGLELQLAEKRPSGWEGRLSYTVQESHSSMDNENLSNSPRHLAKINIIAPVWQKKLFAGVEGQEVSKRLTVWDTKIGGFFVANATLYSREMLGGMQLSASLYNAFNKRYEDAVGQEFRQNGLPQDRRTFRIKLTYRFQP
jgi:iron complex outermembrane receptor protein